MKKISKSGVLAAISALLLLTGCGKQVREVSMKEFTSPDGTYSIEADTDYIEVDSGLDNYLSLELPDKHDSGSLAIMQFPKKGNPLGGFSSLDEFIEFMENANSISDKKEYNIPDNKEFIDSAAYTCTITEDGNTCEASLLYWETSYAHYLLLNTEPVINPHDDDYLRKVCVSFQENAEIISAKSTPSTDLSDTIRWFNASNSVLIDANGWDYQIFGGLEPGDAAQITIRHLLDNSWGVTDTDSANETLDWLLLNGHRADFEADMEYLKETGIDEISEEERTAFLLANFEMTEETALYYTKWYGRYEKYGESAASGWDYNRALSQIANFYLAGYYSLEEALDASLSVAETIQADFDSWDDYMESYFTGYEYWAEESSDGRREIYESLQNAPDNPFAVDFNTRLEKTW